MKKRIFRTKDQIEAHLKAWKESGLNQTQYCKEQKIPYTSFENWKKRYSSIESDKGLVPVRIIPERNSSPLYLCFNDKLKIEIREGFNPVLLKDLLKALGTK